MSLTIREIKEKLIEQQHVDESFVMMLRDDQRKGVQLLLKQYDLQKKKIASLEKMHEEMQTYENSLREDGYTLIAGIDEAGRGPLAGPVVAAAVILPPTFRLIGMTDSKQLSKQKREEFSLIIKREAIAYSIQMIHANEIDHINIYEATKLAMKRAVESLHPQPDHLLIDALTLSLQHPQTPLVKGDQKSISIAAGSILAKVARDEYMKKISKKYPQYGFDSHVGYGTKDHLEALQMHGITPEHRRSFRPVREVDVG